MERKKNRKQKWMALVILMLIWQITAGLAVYAAEEKTENDIMEIIKGYRNSIVHIESQCWDGREKIYSSRSFSGFLVSEDSSGIYVATVCDGLTYTAEEKEQIKADNQLENNNNISEKIDVVFSGDLRVEASIVGQSEQRNLSVLKLNQNISFDHIPSFARENDLMKKQIFLLSYPEFEKQGKANYSVENVNISSGMITGAYKQNEIVFLRHDIEADHDSIGGVLLDSDGMIAGLLLKSKGEKDGSAISGSEIKAFLDTFNISYTEQEEIVETAKKMPVLQIVLGVVILFLLLQVLLQVHKNRKFAKTGRIETKKTEKKNSQKTAKSVAQSPKKAGKKENARLEYPDEKREIKIKNSTFIIGRATESNLILGGEKGISRKHACIQSDGKDYYIIDMKSTNHTFLNGSELKPGDKQILKDGDEIIFAKERMIFRKDV